MIVKGIDTKDFGYLLGYVTDGKVYNIDNNIEYIKKNKAELLQKIDEKLEEEDDDFWEEKQFKISKELAASNLKKLKEIIKKV